MKNFITIVVLLLLSLRVMAGDAGGISLLVKALPSARDYKYVLDGFFRNYYGVDNPHTPSCDKNDYTPYIDNVYLNTLPEGINDNILMRSITDVSTRNQIAKILSSYSDDQVSGFDGVLFYAVKNNRLFIYTFDSKAPEHIFTNELNVYGIISYKLLGESICQSIRSKILPSSP